MWPSGQMQMGSLRYSFISVLYPAPQYCPESQAVDPALFAYLPSGQIAQLVAPGRSVYVCLPHGEHSADPQVENDPGRQSEQAVAPADSDAVPAGHGLQAGASVVLEYVPGEHSAHGPSPSAGRYDPGAHGRRMQSIMKNFESWPGHAFRASVSEPLEDTAGEYFRMAPTRTRTTPSVQTVNR